MRSLPIFRAPESHIDAAAPLAPDSACQRCSHKGGTLTTTCLPHEGEAGGILVVDSFPTRTDFATRRPLASSTASTVRQILAESGQPVAYTTALRCAPRGDTSTAKLATGLEACRPYLLGTIDAIQPRKIIALGGPAIYALTGSVVQPQTMRGGFSWLHVGGRWIPIHYATGLAPSARNRFLRAWMEEDVRLALEETPTNPPEDDAKALLVETEAEARAAVMACNASRWTAVDAEWAGRPYDRDFKLLCIGLAPAPERGNLNDPRSNSAFVFTAQAMANPDVRRVLCDWLRDPAAKKVGSYFKADTVAFHAGLGVWTRGVAFDTRLLRRLLDPEASGKLADMAHLVGRGGHKDELKEAMSKAVAAYKRAAKRGTDLFGKAQLPPNALPSHGEKLLAGAEVERYGFAFVDPDLLYRYNAADTTVTAKLGARLEQMLEQQPEGMQQVAHLVVRPAADTYARIESWGMGIDRAGLETFRDYLTLQLAEVAERFRAYGFDPQNPEASTFNPNSNASIGRLLFDTLKLKATKQTDSGADSTDADALEALADQHPVVKDLLLWRKLGKLQGTYAEGLLGHIRDDGRIHPSIHPDGARTGRTSSSDPNLQNQPSTESPDPEQAKLAKMLRDCFVPAPGHVLVEFDYSQLELRVAADLSGDPAMLDIFRRGEDYHLRTAKMLSQTLWGITPEEVTGAHRREVKGVNFALLYDDDPYGIAFRIGADVKQAEKVRDAIFGCFPVLAKWIKARVAETQRTGYAWTWWAGQPARRRPLTPVADPDSPAGKTARRGAWNGPIQGTGNEYLVASAIEAVDWILGDGIPAKLLVTIHDSMLFEVRADAVSEVHERIPQIMASHQTKNGVPLLADAKIGLTWARMKSWKAGAPMPELD